MNTDNWEYTKLEKRLLSEKAELQEAVTRKDELIEKQETDQTKGDDADSPEPEAQSPAPAGQTTTQQAPGEQK